MSSLSSITDRSFARDMDIVEQQLQSLPEQSADAVPALVEEMNAVCREITTGAVHLTIAGLEGMIDRFTNMASTLEGIHIENEIPRRSIGQLRALTAIRIGSLVDRLNVVRQLPPAGIHSV